MHRTEHQENQKNTELHIAVHTPDGRTIRFCSPPGQKLLTILQEQERTLLQQGLVLPFSGNCGGRGSCGRCRVCFLEGCPLPSHADRIFFTPQELRDGMRLACTAVLRQDCRVLLSQQEYQKECQEGDEEKCEEEYEKECEEKRKKKIDFFGQTGFEDLLNNNSNVFLGNCNTALKIKRERELTVVTENGTTSVSIANDDTGEEIGELIIAADIGTTTIAMQLAERTSGKVLAVQTFLNPGRIYGADVVSRIQAAVSGRQSDMQQTLREALEEGIGQLLQSQDKKSQDKKSQDEKSQDKKSQDKKSQGGHPIMVVCAGNTAMSHLLMGTSLRGLAAAPFEPGDISLRKTRLAGYPAVVLPGVSAFVGGDIVAGLYACGMQESDKLSLYLDLGTNGEMVLGRKGSFAASSAAAGPAFEGLADGGYGADRMAVIAQLLRSGIIDGDGLMQERYFETGITLQGITIKQQDIRQFQLAKAAVRCGIEELFREYGASPEEVETVFLAGGFGYYLQEEDALCTGLLPPVFAGKVISVGNAALAGALRYGMEQPRKEQLQELTDSIRAVNLAQLADFGQHYLELLSFGER